MSMVTNAGHADPELQPGERVGDHRIMGTIASGGFGTVYRAEHVNLGTPAALKVLHPELSSTPSAVLRFHREVEVIRRIRHPNVIEIFGSGQLPDGRPYFVMELLRGISLDVHMRVRRRLPSDEVLGILEPLCGALNAAHTQGVIHRDLKTPNVFLSEEGEATRVVLLDFGVAKVLDPSARGITSPSAVVGTPSCMAPEQIRSEQATTRTDIYALGVLAYYMLTGELPFYDLSHLTMQSMHLFVTPAKPSSIAPIGTSFDDVVLRALRKDPSERYATVLDFLEAFREATEASRVTQPDIGGCRAVGLHIEIWTSEAELAEPDERLFLDIESILPLAAAILLRSGLAVAVQTGNTMLCGAVLPTDTTLERARRLDAIRAALTLRHELMRRPTRDPRVRVCLCVHAGAARAVGDKIHGGELLDLSSWVSEEFADTIVASPPVLEGLDVPTQPVGGSSNLLYVLDPASRAP